MKPEIILPPPMELTINGREYIFPSKVVVKSAFLSEFITDLWTPSEPITIVSPYLKLYPVHIEEFIDFCLESGGYVSIYHCAFLMDFFSIDMIPDLIKYTYESKLYYEPKHYFLFCHQINIKPPSNLIPEDVQYLEALGFNLNVQS